MAQCSCASIFGSCAAADGTAKPAASTPAAVAAEALTRSRRSRLLSLLEEDGDIIDSLIGRTAPLGRALSRRTLRPPCPVSQHEVLCLGSYKIVDGRLACRRACSPPPCGEGSGVGVPRG